MNKIIDEEKAKLDKLCRLLTQDSFENQKNLLQAIFVESEYIKQLESLNYMEEVLTTETKPTYYTVADVFKRYEGTREYDGIVAIIQQWFYGSVIESPWCATSMCWALAQLGLRAYTIGGKYENVYDLKQALSRGVSIGQCQSVSIYNMEYGDIVILNFDGNFSPTSSKHVTSFVEYKKDGWFSAIGGNQDDSIKFKDYNQENIVAVYRPQYSKGTLKNIDTLPKA